jgi:hypothetical protein
MPLDAVRAHSSRLSDVSLPPHLEESHSHHRFRRRSLPARHRREEPNVVLILADDLGYETIGANGGTSYSTPSETETGHFYSITR